MHTDARGALAENNVKNCWVAVDGKSRPIEMTFYPIIQLETTRGS